MKSSDYGEEGLWADRADRVAGVADVIGSDAFADEMRRFLPAGLMTSTVESPRWSAWAIEQIGTLYGTPALHRRPMRFPDSLFSVRRTTPVQPAER